MIIVLEDDPRRSNEMRVAIADSTLVGEVLFFDNAFELLRWIPNHIGRIQAASLDCDLDTTIVRESKDVGSGADVVDDLASRTPHFPVVIHSSNAMRAPAMHMTLALAGWPRVRLSPFKDAGSWLADLVELMNQDT